MSTLLERLRRALAPQYEVERELARGGMGVVFTARDPRLDRAVAVKILRPELATAAAADRFLREARLLASVRHPNIVPIHAADERDGIPFFVMDLLEGDTLEQHLQAAPLPLRSAHRLGRDLLRALEAVHGRGIVHRDIKPANIFLMDGRFVLGDFGIAKRTGAGSDALTGPGGVVGTPAYMAPEQLAGADATARTDLWAVGAVLYRAVTGRLWEACDRPAAADWGATPRRWRRAVARALQLAPADRYPDARAFRRALERAVGNRAAAAAVVGVGIVGIIAAILLPGWDPPMPAEPARADVALAPFAVRDPADADWLAEDLPRVVWRHLDPAVAVASPAVTFRWWDSVRAGVSSPGRAAWERLGARHLVLGTVDRRGDELSVVLQLLDSADQTLPLPDTIRGSIPAFEELGFAVAQAILRAVDPARATAFEGSPAVRGRRSDAVRALVAADGAFAREAWAAAALGYQRALALDSSLGLAWWGLYNAGRWAREPTGVDLRDVLDHRGAGLTAADRHLIEAELADPGPERLALYGRAIDRAPRDATARLLYGNELFHRGPLFGVGLDSAVRVLRDATVRNEVLGPAFSTLAWALIRQGDSAAARAAIERYRWIAAPTATPGLCFACFLEFAWTERFVPGEAGRARDRLLADLHDPAARLAFIRQALRWGPSVGIPQTALDLAERWAGDAGRSPPERAELHETRGLMLWQLGRPDAALAQFDSAAALFGTDDARLQALAWRTVSAALEMPGRPGPDPEVRGAVTAFTSAASEDVRLRAWWLLGIDARARNDREVLDRALRALRAARPALAAFLAAWGDPAADPASVLAATDSVRSLLTAADRGAGDPFTRTVLYVLRGRWAARAGDHAGAAREWGWHEAADLPGWPAGPASVGEVDWAFGTYGMLLGARAADAAGNRAVACASAREVTRRWERAEPALQEARREAAALAARCR